MPRSTIALLNRHRARRRRRGIIPAWVWIALVLVAAATVRAHAGVFEFQGLQRDGVGGVNGLNAAMSVAMSPDGAHVYVGGSGDGGIAMFRRDAGGLTYVGVVLDGVGGVDGLKTVRSIAVAPDGRHVYAAGFGDNAVAVFSRDGASGALAFVELHRDGPATPNLAGAHGVAVSPDGAHVYVAAALDHAVSAFRRDAATGRLTFVGAGVKGTGGVTGLGGAETVAVSPDGAHVYVAAQDDDTLTAFRRDSATGALTLIEIEKHAVGGVTGLDRVQGVVVSPDGAHVYTAAGTSNALAAFRRDPASGQLTFFAKYVDGTGGIDGLGGAEWVAMSPDGSFVLAAGDVDHALAVFERNPATGALIFLERHRDGTGGVDGIQSAEYVVASPDGKNVYVAGNLDHAVATFGALCGNGRFDAGEECEDGNAVGGDCCTARCTAAPAGSACAADGNPCTDDKCNGDGLCLHVNNSLPCDDGAWCTLDDRCVNRACQGTPRSCPAASDQCHEGVCEEAGDQCVIRAKRDGAACEDGNPCTRDDVCRSGGCTTGGPAQCAPIDVCHTAGTCDRTTGACSNPPALDGTPCDDGNACTRTDRCLAGVCVGAEPVACTALDACHDAGTCDPATGTCSHPLRPDGAVCDDGNACTRADRCSAGRCVGTDRVECAPLDGCHGVGVCDPRTGACSNPVKPDGAACEDGNACTRTDRCVGAVCVGSDPVTCTAPDACHDAGTCDATTGVCSRAARPNGSACDDGDACTRTDQCVDGACRGADPVTCSAPDDCHEAGGCDRATGVCTSPAKADGLPCDDGNFCTRTDRCLGGACVGRDPVACAAVDQCHSAGACDPATGVCAEPPKPDGSRCDDGDLCTRTDHCAGGACVGLDPVLCTAVDSCHETGVCNPATGMCTSPVKVDGLPCDDGDLCTRTDRCLGGTCVGRDPVACAAVDQCHDAGVCDPWTGVCTSPGKPDGVGCDDGDPCTRDDVCEGGACRGSARDCAGLTDACNVGACDPLVGACVARPRADGTGCDDGSYCNGLQVCAAGTCQPPVPVRCDDAIPCTRDACDESTRACTHVPDDVSCADGRLCNGAERCVPAVGCQPGPAMACGDDGVACTVERCDETAGGCVHEPTAALCADADVCTADACDPALGCTHGPSGFCRPGTIALPAVADTWIDAGDGATWDHGAAPVLFVDRSPRALVYLKFDLRNVPSTVLRATLRLTSTVGSQAGGTIYSVSDHNWVEGTGAGDGANAGGAGLKWVDVDTDRDGQVTASDTSPYVPAYGTVVATIGRVTTGQSYEIDVTRAFQHGAGHYAVAIDDGASNAAGWASREHGTSTSRPLLLLELGAGPECATAADCDDGLFCTGAERCGGGLCRAGVAPVCNDGIACTLDRCDETADACRADPAADGTRCDDGDACTRGDACRAGVCRPGSATSCTPLDGCHDAGVCDPATGVCSNPAKTDGVSCNDGSACTRRDTCSAGACVGGDRVGCAAVDACHGAGACDPATGLCGTPPRPNGTACDDGNACTRQDECRDGVCAGTPVVCAARDACHAAGVCDPATGACSNPNAAEGTPCDDGNACTRRDSCAGGTCVGTDPVVCVAADGCHEAGTCAPATGTCTSPAKVDGTPCDDGNVCTRRDTCGAGRCVGADPVVCVAADGCHEAGACLPATGTCTSPVKADGTGCDDGNECTRRDTCAVGRCVGSDAVVCVAADGCHEAGTCVPATGMCTRPTKADGTRCDDGDVCTRRDTCAAGTCVGTDPVVCAAVDACHEPGTCSAATGACTRPVKADGSACDDGDRCSAGDTCRSGICLGTDQRTCLDDPTCPCEPVAVCGDGALNRQEETCDGMDAMACPGACRADCTCPPAPTCGDGVVNGAAEDCDGADARACPAACRADCTCPLAPACGDGVINQPAEECDGAAAPGCPGACRGDCTCPPSNRCGNGAVDAPGEECDGSDSALCPGLCRRDCVCSVLTLRAGITADASVREDAPTQNFGTGKNLWVDATTGKHTFLQARVDGVGDKHVVAARLRLRVAPETSAASNAGGRVFAMRTCAWDERGVTWATRPALDGGLLDQRGAVVPGQTVEFDVTAAIAGDGVHCLGLDSTSGDGAAYESREAGGPAPELVLTLEPPAIPVCGDGLVNQTTEACDGADDAACAGSCRADCSCPSAARCGDGIVNRAGEQCDGVDAAACPGACRADCTCPTIPACGDGVVNRSVEQCDGTDAAACPGQCRSDCRCPTAAVCGDGLVNQAGEECDGATAAACPGACRADCRCATATIAGTIAADAGVREDVPAQNYGTGPSLWADAVIGKRSFFRVVVEGVGGRRVTAARLRLRVEGDSSAASNAGGRVHRVSACAWDERTLTWASQPALDGGLLAQVGAVLPGQVVEFDITGAIAGDGIYCLGLESPSTDGVAYAAREAGTGFPNVTITVAAPVAPACGDGVVNQDGEICDGTDAAACPGACRADCTCPPAAGATCGDGAVNRAGEICDGVDAAACPGACRADCTCPPVVVATCGDGVINQGRETCDGAAAAACPGACRVDCTCPPVAAACGDGVVNQPWEACDGADATACPGLCRADCQCGIVTVTAAVVADVGVREDAPTQNFGGNVALWADAVTGKRSFFRVAVAGVEGRRVLAARLRLRVGRDNADASNSGGRLHGVGACAWNELGVTWAAQPALDGGVLDQIGAVTPGTTVEFDVTAAIAGDGVYCLGLDSPSTDGVAYEAREAGGTLPQVVLTIEATAVPRCGDEVVNQPSEACDGSDDGTCLGTCRDDCTCAPPVCGDGNVNQIVEQCDGIDAAACPGYCLADCVCPPPICGDDHVNQAVEECDGIDSAVCPDLCTTGCLCDTSLPVAVIEADVWVRAAEPERNFAAHPSLGADHDPEERAFLRARVRNIGSRPVLGAWLRLEATGDTNAGSDAGGRLLAVTDCAWDETQVTWNRQPALSGPVLDVAGAVAPGGAVEFDVASVVDDDGIYCFALDGTSADGVTYRAREALVGRPRLEVVASGTCGDGVVNQLAEECDGFDDGVCPSACLADCRCAVCGDAQAEMPAEVCDGADAGACLDQCALDCTCPLLPTPTFACLRRAGAVRALAGTYLAEYRDDALPARIKLDARAATFVAWPSTDHPINLGGGPGACLSGGTVRGQYDRTLTWTEMHDFNNAGVAFTNADFTVDGVRIDNMTDGIRPRDGDRFTIRNAWLSGIRDDCVENDHLQGGFVDDSLLDGCYVGFSARPSPANIASGFNGAAKLWTIRNSLVRLEPMPGPDGGAPGSVGHGGFFKWHLWTDPAASLSPKLALYDNVFMATQDGNVGEGRMGTPPDQVVDCADNTMVWLGPGDFPGVLPSCFTVTRDRRVWDAAVADWHARHPQVGS